MALQWRKIQSLLLHRLSCKSMPLNSAEPEILPALLTESGINSHRGHQVHEPLPHRRRRGGRGSTRANDNFPRFCLAGVIKLGDFGVSRQMSEKTMCLHSFYGTPLYFSPEIIEGAGQRAGQNRLSAHSSKLLSPLICCDGHVLLVLGASNAQHYGGIIGFHWCPILSLRTHNVGH